MRYEKKFRIENIDFHVVRQVFSMHLASFHHAYPARQVNNIYLDTPGLTTFEDNVMGISERQKFRIRWYGENVMQAGSPKFEIKAKQNMLGSKSTHAIPSFRLDDLEEPIRQVNRLSGTMVPLRPVLLNSYHRTYLATRDEMFRATIDSNLRYHSLLCAPRFRHYLISDQAIIVEIKFERQYFEQVARIIQALPFRVTKSSKYVTGVLLTN